MYTYDYNDNSQTEDVQSGMNATQAKKAPNIFKQLIYSVMPGKYGELANVKVKGFICYNLFWCFIMCSVIWTAMLIFSFGESLENGNIWADDGLLILILILIGIGIPICLIMTIIMTVILATSYFSGPFVTALIIKGISKKQCSMFDLYKSAVYCQTPVNLAILCMLVGETFLGDNEDLLIWLILKGISLVILIFGIQNLPAKPFIPGNKQSATEGNQYRPESNQYPESSQYRTESNQYKAESVNQVSSTPSKPRVTPGYWTCTCGRENPSYTGTCTCGKSKY